MATASDIHPNFESAIALCASTLGKIADYELEPSLQQRLQDLGERKEFLSPKEHEELSTLVNIAQRRTIESLEAKLALKRL